MKRALFWCMALSGGAMTILVEWIAILTLSGHPLKSPQVLEFCVILLYAIMLLCGYARRRI